MDVGGLNFSWCPALSQPCSSCYILLFIPVGNFSTLFEETRLLIFYDGNFPKQLPDLQNSGISTRRHEGQIGNQRTGPLCTGPSDLCCSVGASSTRGWLDHIKAGPSAERDAPVLLAKWTRILLEPVRHTSRRARPKLPAFQPPNRRSKHAIAKNPWCEVQFFLCTWSLRAQPKELLCVTDVRNTTSRVRRWAGSCWGGYEEQPWRRTQSDLVWLTVPAPGCA